jgi:purine nucleoside phosphorylase
VARLGVVAGHSVLGASLHTELGLDADERSIPVRGGPVWVVDAGDVVFLQRHGAVQYSPAHRIDHHAHAHALARVGVDRVLAISSVGTLRPEHPVGTVLVPDDFVGLANQPDSRFVDERGHCVPGLDREWRAQVVKAWAHHASRLPVDGGTYWQATGPRFETAAEVRYLATFADVVGMTMAAESVAMRERGIAYAAVCIVDNLANGVDTHELTVEEFEAGKAANRAGLVATLTAALPELIGSSP